MLFLAVLGEVEGVMNSDCPSTLNVRRTDEIDPCGFDFFV